MLSSGGESQSTLDSSSTSLSSSVGIQGDIFLWLPTCAHPHFLSTCVSIESQALGVVQV